MTMKKLAISLAIMSVFTTTSVFANDNSFLNTQMPEVQKLTLEDFQQGVTGPRIKPVADALTLVIARQLKEMETNPWLGGHSLTAILVGGGISVVSAAAILPEVVAGTTFIQYLGIIGGGLIGVGGASATAGAWAVVAVGAGVAYVIYKTPMMARMLGEKLGGAPSAKEVRLGIARAMVVNLLKQKKLELLAQQNKPAQN